MYLNITKILIQGAKDDTEVSYESYYVSDGNHCVIEGLTVTLNNTRLNIQIFYSLPQTHLVFWLYLRNNFYFRMQH
jgi:hypothetical protein